MKSRYFTVKWKQLERNFGAGPFESTIFEFLGRGGGTEVTTETSLRIVCVHDKFLTAP
jgi:hypothetical protein